MKNVTKLFGIVFSITIFLQSCGSSVPETNTVEVKDVYIPGIASDFIEVVDGNYEFKYTLDGEKERILLPVTLKLKKEIGLKDPGMGYLQLMPLNSDGTKIGQALEADGDKVSDFLRSDAGSEVTLNFTITNSMFGLEEGDAAKIMNDAVNFEFDMTDISGYYLDGGSTNQWDGETLYLDGVGSSSSNNSSSNSGGGEDWDEVLDDYEEFVNEYIKVYKKAMEGDMGAMSEYSALMEKATSLSEKLESAKSDLTSKQIGRMTKIQTKMLQAATGN